MTDTTIGRTCAGGTTVEWVWVAAIPRGIPFKLLTSASVSTRLYD